MIQYFVVVLFLIESRLDAGEVAGIVIAIFILIIIVLCVTAYLFKLRHTTKNADSESTHMAKVFDTKTDELKATSEDNPALTFHTDEKQIDAQVADSQN